MSLSAGTVEVLKASVPLLEKSGVDIIGRFYQNMFRDNPQLRDVFNMSHLPHVEDESKKPANSPQAVSLAHSVLAYASNADNLNALVPALETIAEKHVAFFVKPELYPVVGKYLLESLKVQLGDGASDEIMNAWKEAYDFLADLLIKMEKKRFEEKESAKGGWRETRQFVVEAKSDETVTGGIKSFCLRPKDGEAVTDFKAGQYVTLKIPQGTPGCPAAARHSLTRNYSLSRAPSTENDGSLRISVKREGAASDFLHEQVQPGQTLQVGPPCGTFVLPQALAPDAHLLFVAAGVGITSVLSLLEAALQKRAMDGSKVALVQCCKTREEHPMREAVEKMVKDTGMKAYAFYSQTKSTKDEGSIKTKTGRLTAKALKKIVSEPNKTEVFFCGPNSFMMDVRQMLKDLGIPQQQLHSEYYGPTRFMD